MQEAALIQRCDLRTGLWNAFSAICAGLEALDLKQGVSHLTTETSIRRRAEGVLGAVGGYR